MVEVCTVSYIQDVRGRGRRSRGSRRARLAGSSRMRSIADLTTGELPCLTRHSHLHQHLKYALLSVLKLVHALPLAPFLLLCPAGM